MASAQDVLLQADVHRESQAEYAAWKEYQKQLEEQAEDDSIAAIVGTLLGATIGFLVGGAPGLGFGMSLGGSTAYTASAWENYDENERFLARDVFKGGKFQSWETEELAEEARELNEEMYDQGALMGDWMAKTALALVAKNVAGNTFTEAEKAAWGDMSFGEKIGSLGKASPLDTESGTTIQTSPSQMGGTFDSAYVMPEVSVSAATQATPFRDLVAGAGRFGRNLKQGVMSMGTPNTMGFDTVQSFNTASKIGRGDLTVEDMLMLSYANETDEMMNMFKKKD